MQLGDKLTLVLIAAYVVIGLAYAVNGKWPQTLYYVGAVILQAAVLLMSLGVAR